jgi:septal ring factor EnvC (AmiA/AmiB activator)
VTRNGRRAPRALLLALGFVCAGGARAEGAASSATDGAEPTASLERLQHELDTRRARVEAYARREQGLLDTLDAVDQSAARISQEVVRARRESREAAAALHLAEATAQRFEAESIDTRRALAARAVQLYREGKAGPLRFLAGAESLPDLLARARALRFALERDGTLLAQAKTQRDALVRAQEEAARSAAANARALQRLDDRAHALDLERESKRALLAGLRTDGDRERSALAELEAAARALEETLAGLGATLPKHAPAAPAVPFTSLRGRLRAPVPAPVARRFGRVVDADFHTAIFRKGFEFSAPAGTGVRAVAAGEVRFAGWFRGYGRMVILDHGEGYFTVSAHLDEIRVALGDPVAADQSIGTVGDTGSLSGPLLYFEIRRGSEPLDPARWLTGGTGLE